MVPPPGLGWFWIESLYQLVIGYHWLAFLNQVHKQSKTQSTGSQFTRNFEYKIDHISETIYCKKSENRFCIRFRTLCVFWDTSFYILFLLMVKSTISQMNKNRIIIFFCVTAHCASYMQIWPLLRGVGVCMSLIGTNRVIFFLYKNYNLNSNKRCQ